jgi:hypothetical protein
MEFIHHQQQQNKGFLIPSIVQSMLLLAGSGSFYMSRQFLSCLNNSTDESGRPIALAQSNNANNEGIRNP